MPAKKSDLDTVKGFLEENKGKIARALPKHLDPSRMLSIVLSSIEKTPDLLKCDTTSLLNAVMTSSSLGLEPDGVLGQAYIIPYENKKQKKFEAQFQVGYKGLIALARRSGDIVSLSAQAVYEKDKFQYAYGLDEKLVHIPADGERGNLKFAYAVAKFKDGGHAFEVMTKTDILKIKRSSQGANSDYSPWNKFPEEMWRKTAVKKLCKYLPMSVDLQRVAAMDEYIDMGLDEQDYSHTENMTSANKNNLKEKIAAQKEKQLAEDTTQEQDEQPEEPEKKALTKKGFTVTFENFVKDNRCDIIVSTELASLGFESLDDVGKEDYDMVLRYFEENFTGFKDRLPE
jgi:recombination protein RecT